MVSEQDTDTPSAARTGPVSILIVDDEVALRQSLAEGLSLLRSDQFEPFCVASVDEALQMLSDGEFAAVVTDLRMPGKDGLQLLLEMKERSLAIPTVVMTAYGSPSVHAQAAKRGAVRYIEKPFQLEQLIEILETVTAPKKRAGRGSPLDIIEVLELLCLGKKDMAVQVRAGGDQGVVYVSDGEIVHAEFIGRDGPEALFELLALRHAHVATTPGEISEKTSVSQSWQELTEEAWRRRTKGSRPRGPVREDGHPDEGISEAPRGEEQSAALLPPWSELSLERIEAAAKLAVRFVKEPHVLSNRGSEGLLLGILRTAGLSIGPALELGSFLGCVARGADNAMAIVPLTATKSMVGPCRPHALIEEDILLLRDELTKEEEEDDAVPERRDFVETVEEVAAKQLRALPEIKGVVVADQNGRMLASEDSEYSDEMAAIAAHVMVQASRVGSVLGLGAAMHVTATQVDEAIYFVGAYGAVAALSPGKGQTPWSLADNAAGILSVI